MRSLTELTHVSVKDLGDQKKAAYILFVSPPRHSSFAIYVDGITFEPDYIRGLRYMEDGEHAEIVIFIPKDAVWHLIAADELDTYSGQDSLNVARLNVEQETLAHESFKAIKAAAEEGRSNETWLRNQLGGLDGPR